MQRPEYPELYDFRAWETITPERLEATVEAVLAQLGPHYRRQSTGSAARGPVVRIDHVPTGVPFVLIPGGSFGMGFTEAEEAALRKAPVHKTGGGALQVTMTTAEGETQEMSYGPNDEQERVESWLRWTHMMRPVHAVTLEPFLMAQFPLREQHAMPWLDHNFNSRIFSGDKGAIYLTPEEIFRIEEATSFRRPSESQWQYACRAGTDTLFYWGDNVPEKPVCGTNGFGLQWMAEYIELLADHWVNSYEGAPTDGAPRIVPGQNLLMAKGGAYGYYPWQDSGEWLSYLSGGRMTFDLNMNDAIDRQAAFRPVRMLWEEEKEIERKTNDAGWGAS